MAKIVHRFFTKIKIKIKNSYIIHVLSKVTWPHVACMVFRFGPFNKLLKENVQGFEN